MEVKVKPLSPEHHGHLKLKKGPHLSAIKHSNNVDIGVHEFSSVACEVPIIFIKDQDSGQFRSVAVTGINLGENLLFENGEWVGNFIPHSIGNAPFYLGQADGSNRLEDAVLLVDEGAGVLGDEGTPLFNEDGSYSEYVQQTKTSLQEYVKLEQLTKQFIGFLVEKELLVSRSLDIEAEGKSISLNGIYLIDIQKLDQLSNEDFLTIRQLGYLSPIYSHLAAIQQFPKLMKLRNKRYS